MGGGVDLKYPKYEALRKVAEKIIIEMNNKIDDENVKNINALCNRFINNPYDIIGMNVFIKMNACNEYNLEKIEDDKFHDFVMEQERGDFYDEPIELYEGFMPRYILNIDSWGMSKGNQRDPITMIERDVNEFYIERLSSLYSESFKDTAIDNMFVSTFGEIIKILFQGHTEINDIYTSVKYLNDTFCLSTFIGLIVDEIVDVCQLVSSNFNELSVYFESLNSSKEQNNNDEFDTFLDSVETMTEFLNNGKLFKDETDNT